MTEAKRSETLVIRNFPDPFLSKKAVPWIDVVTEPSFVELLDALENTLVAHQAAGLAGPQVGIGYRILSVIIKDKPLTMINPTVTKVYGEPDKAVEGCLSFPGLWLRVARRPEIEVEFTDRDGKQVKAVFEGQEARAVQHEIDHLDGINFIDRIPKVLRSQALKKYRLAPRVQRQQTEHMKAVIKRFNEQQVTKKVVQVKAETEAVLKEAVATPETLSP